MTKPNKTEIVVILDRSGSMSDIQKDMEGGFNSFVQEQKKLAEECTVTLVQFDTVYEVVYSNLPLSEVPVLSWSPAASLLSWTQSV